MGQTQRPPIDGTRVRQIFGYDENGLYRLKNGKRSFLANSKGYRGFKIDRVMYLEHRLVWMFHFEFAPDTLDHINGNPADNRVENLRPATRSQNMYNRHKSVNNTSGVKGVYFEGRTGKWVARLRCNKKKIHVGRFKTVEDAALAMQFARTDAHGTFANFGV